MPWVGKAQKKGEYAMFHDYSDIDEMIYGTENVTIYSDR